MKKLLILLLFLSCRSNELTIASKSYLTVERKPMPKDICRYWYNNGWELQEFHDSCSKYSVGDKIK